jgi:uncharacterized MAPEG superfamily protein
MQRTVEQRQRPKRRVAAPRRDPRATFGFTARQRPFIIVLVANWIFSLTFFLGMKLIWHWQPEDWGIADRIALVLKDAVFALLPGVIGICIVAAQRLNPSMFVGQTPKPNSSVDINNKFILNTFEQFTAYFVANAGLAMYCPPEEARSLPLLTALFVMGRILFWIGYHKNPYLRAFGFGITFYPTVAAFAWLVLIMVFGIRIPL